MDLERYKTITESKAIQTVFPNFSSAPFVSSTKSTHGHMLGAGSAVEAIAAILAIQKQKIPATTHFNKPDPLCALNLVINQPIEAEVKRVLSNSFAFGGLNVSLLFEAINVNT